ncbi:MAG: lipoprotein insertase outer membrane protein LolB [Pseudomonadales bacterium]
MIESVGEDGHGSGARVRLRLGSACNNTKTPICRERRITTLSIRPKTTATWRRRGFIGTGLLVLVLTQILGGCVSAPKPQLRGPSDFLVSGKMAVRAPEGNFSARFRWIQTGGSYDLELWGPFGQGRRRLAGNHQTLSVLDGRGELLLRGAPGQVMLEQLGFEVPLGSLAFWIQGLPDPQQPQSRLSRNAQGEVAGFRQASWDVAYPSYVEASADRRLPKRVEAVNERYQVKLAISRWDV